MATFIEIAKASDLEDGHMTKVNVGDGAMLLARVGGEFYAADNACPHMGGDLSAGTLKDTIVTCPKHHSQFDLRDGHVVRWTDWSGLKLAAAKLAKSPRPVKVHEVKVQDGTVLVDRAER